MTDPLRVAVVGSGPSGIYAADALTSQTDLPALVDVIERLPSPFGLVRYGVAPDHASIRSVRDTLQKVLDRENVRFLGNVTVGSDISPAELHDFYDAVVYCYGASSDRRLGIPGEDLPGSVAATDLVAWYTGHPEAHAEEIEAAVGSARSVVVVGVGNVAVDVVRVLAKRLDELDSTEMPQHVLDLLDGTHLTDIHLLGRRGPAQGAFTTKELRELGELALADVLVDPADLELDPASGAKVAGDKVLARNLEVLRGWAARTPEGKPRRIHVRFLTRPVEVVGDGKVEGVVVERTALDESGQAHGTGETSTIAADLVVRSVGYRGLPLDSLPFDASRNVIPSEDGRVHADGAVVPGEYVAGWIKRGPTGIIGTNKKDAAATVASLLADVPSLPKAPHRQPGDIDAYLLARGVHVVDVEGWMRLDAAEQALGNERGRDRTTIHELDQMLDVALSGQPQG
jgi:ferredoxin--NADP+ reductase